MELVLVSDDVDRVFSKAIDKGAIAVQLPVVKPWGQTVAYLRDSTGTLIELCNSMS